MGTINSFYVLVFLTVVAVLYAGWMMYFTMRESRQQGEPDQKQSSPPPESATKEEDNIIGKSRYVLPARSQSGTNAAIAPETEQDTENSNTFVPASVSEHPQQVPLDELDKVFGAVPEGKTNEPLDIDCPLYEEPSIEEEADEFEDEDEDLPFVGNHSALGGQYEDMGEAYRHVVHNPPLTEAQQEKTGRVLLEMTGTGLLEAIVSDNPERTTKVTHLMNTYVSAFYRKMAERLAESLPPPGEVPSTFDIQKFT